MPGTRGRSGRRPKPTKLKELEGTLRPDRANTNEPAPELLEQAPPCPSHLKGEARKAWNQMAQHLTDTGVLTVVDLPALEVYCSIYAEWKEAKAHLEGPVGYCPNCNPRKRRQPVIQCRGSSHIAVPYGPFIRTLRGFAPSPYFRAVDVCRKQLRAYMVEFGITPASRSRINVVDPDEEPDELAQFLRKRASGG